MLTKTGAVTHIIHLMKKDDIEIYASEILGDREDITVDELFIVGQFYAIRKEEVGAIFREHFGLSDGFDVHFYCRKGKKKRALSVGIDARTPTPVFTPIATASPPSRLSMSLGPGSFPYPTGNRGNRSSIVNHEGQLSAALMDFFHGTGGRRFSGMSVEEKMAKMMEVADRVSRKQKKRISVAVPVGNVNDGDDRKEDSIELVMADDIDPQGFDVNTKGNDVVEMEGMEKGDVMDIDNLDTDQMDEIVDVMMETTKK